MPLALYGAAKPRGVNHGQKVEQRSLQIVVDNNIVEFVDMAHLFPRRGDAPGNRLVAVGCAPTKTTLELVKRRWQDEDADCRRKYATYLLRTLPVDLQEHILAGMQRRFDAAGRGAVIVAMYLRPFEEAVALDLVEKILDGYEMVFETIAFASSRRPRGMRNRHPDPRIVLEQAPYQRRFSSA